MRYDFTNANGGYIFRSGTPVVLDKLMLSVEAESWVTIHDSRDQRVAYRLMKAGSQREIEGQAPFKVLLGFAHGAKLTINGQQFDVTPHIKENSARFVIDRP